MFEEERSRRKKKGGGYGGGAEKELQHCMRGECSVGSEHTHTHSDDAAIISDAISRLCPHHQSFRSDLCEQEH